MGRINISPKSHQTEWIIRQSQGCKIPWICKTETLSLPRQSQGCKIPCLFTKEHRLWRVLGLKSTLLSHDKAWIWRQLSLSESKHWLAQSFPETPLQVHSGLPNQSRWILRKKILMACSSILGEYSDSNDILIVRWQCWITTPFIHLNPLLPRMVAKVSTTGTIQLVQGLVLHHSIICLHRQGALRKAP